MRSVHTTSAGSILAVLVCVLAASHAQAAAPESKELMALWGQAEMSYQEAARHAAPEWAEPPVGLRDCPGGTARRAAAAEGNSCATIETPYFTGAFATPSRYETAQAFLSQVHPPALELVALPPTLARAASTSSPPTPPVAAPRLSPMPTPEPGTAKDVARERSPSKTLAAVEAPVPTALPWVFLGVIVAALAGALLKLFSRLSKGAVLSHPKREAILQYLASRPGASAAEIARDQKIHLTTAQHHLRALARHGCLVERRIAGRARYFEPGSAKLSEVPAGPTGTRDRLLAAAETTPGATLSEVALRLGISRQLAHHHARDLSAIGKLNLVREGRNVRLFSV